MISILMMNAFSLIKTKLVTAPIIIAPDWDLPFELMCDGSDYAVGAVLANGRTNFSMQFTTQARF